MKPNIKYINKADKRDRTMLSKFDSLTTQYHCHTEGGISVLNRLSKRLLQMLRFYTLQMIKKEKRILTSLSTLTLQMILKTFGLCACNFKGVM